MSKLREHMLDNKILYRMIAGYTLLCTLIILCMTTLLYNSFKKELQQEIFRYQEQSLRQVSNTVAFRAEYVNYLMQRARQEKEISKLFYPTSGEPVISSLNVLGEMRQSVKQLQSVYIYNEYDETIYSSGERNLSAVSSLDNFEDRGFIEILDHIDQYSKFTPYLRRISLESPNGQVYDTYVYTYLMYDSYSSGSVKNIMAFNLHLGWMEDALDFIMNGESTAEEIWIVNPDREIIYSDSGKLIGTVCGDELFPGDVYENESGYTIMGSGNSKQMLVYATPDHRGYDKWTFLSFNDYSAMLEPMKQVRAAIYIICMITLAASIVVIILLSKRIYEPVRQTIDKVISLEAERAKKLKTDRMLFLRKLFLGNETEDFDKIKERFHTYRIDYSLDLDNRIVLVSVDYGNSFLRRYAKELERVDSRIEELLFEQFGSAYKNIICVKMQEGIWAVCIPAELAGEEAAGEAVLNSPLKGIFEKMNAVLFRELEITVSMAVSDAGHSVRDIPYLYADALGVSSYRYLLGQNQLITSEDIRKQGQKKFEYPYAVEKKLLSSLFSGKAGESLEAYEEFVQEVKNCSVGEIRLSFLLLAYAIKNASSNTTAEVSSILMEFDQFYRKLQTLETIEEVNQLFIHLFGEIAGKLQTYALERHEALIQQIRDYVEEHYGQISLSMNEVADYVDMSAAYLGRLFKQVTGTTFTEYLTKFRLDEACNMLQNTELTVNEISDRVGFTNSSYFYIVFKKNLGCTPNQYRKQGADHN